MKENKSHYPLPFAERCILLRDANHHRIHRKIHYFSENILGEHDVPFWLGHLGGEWSALFFKANLHTYYFHNIGTWSVAKLDKEIMAKEVILLSKSEEDDLSYYLLQSPQEAYSDHALFGYREDGSSICVDLFSNRVFLNEDLLLPKRTVTELLDEKQIPPKPFSSVREHHKSGALHLRPLGSSLNGDFQPSEIRFKCYHMPHILFD